MEVPRATEYSASSTPPPRRKPQGLLPLCLILLSGCQAHSLSHPQAFSTSPELPVVVVSASRNRGEGLWLSDAVGAPGAESCLAHARQLHDDGCDGCVDQYYRAALLAWRDLEGTALEGVADSQDETWRIYQESVAGLLETAQQFRRLDPRGSLTIVGHGGPQVIPIAYYGFAWRPADFCQLLSAEEYRDSALAHHYRTPGLGVSLVALRLSRQEDSYYRPRQPFAVTAILRPSETRKPPSPNASSATNSECPEAVLEFYNPSCFSSVGVGVANYPLQRDLTAPFVLVANESSRSYLEGFLDPGETDVQPKLLMMEPYQRGKLPVIFIHGLLSDPTTWLDAANELRAQADLFQQFQFWYFRYPTGGSLLESAASLREQLLAVRETCDPTGTDAALSHMVLVGHSMGGLMARLQVTYSSDILWRHAARQPLEAVRTTPALRQRLERDFFFDPSPLVKRVVFIGTPHRGSNMARRLVGRIASSLVEPFTTTEPAYQQLMDENQEVFFDYLHRSPPTSIDLLEPSNPLLSAMASMPFGRCVRLHSIVGTGGNVLGPPSDGVVPVSSAHLEGVSSELLVPATHSQLHHDPVTLAELARILREHARSTMDSI